MAREARGVEREALELLPRARRVEGQLATTAALAGSVAGILRTRAALTTVVWASVVDLALNATAAWSGLMPLSARTSGWERAGVDAAWTLLVVVWGVIALGAVMAAKSSSKSRARADEKKRARAEKRAGKSVGGESRGDADDPLAAMTLEDLLLLAPDDAVLSLLAKAKLVEHFGQVTVRSLAGASVVWLAQQVRSFADQSDALPLAQRVYALVQLAVTNRDPQPDGDSEGADEAAVEDAIPSEQSSAGRPGQTASDLVDQARIYREQARASLASAFAGLFEGFDDAVHEIAAVDGSFVRRNKTPGAGAPKRNRPASSAGESRPSSPASQAAEEAALRALRSAAVAKQAVTGGGATVRGGVYRELAVSGGSNRVSGAVVLDKLTATGGGNTVDVYCLAGTAVSSTGGGNRVNAVRKPATELARIAGLL